MISFEDDFPVSFTDFAKIFGYTENYTYSLIKRNSDIFRETKKLKRSSYIGSRHVLSFRKQKKLHLQFSKKIISFYMRKGGVGKTTILYNMAVKSSLNGFKTLILDMDSQANATKMCKIDKPKSKQTFLNIYRNEVTPQEAVEYVKGNLYIIPSNVRIEKLAAEIDSMNGYQQFKLHLDALKEEFDYIFIDCGCTMDMSIFQTIACSDYVISPAVGDDFSEEGLELTKESIDKVNRAGYFPKFKIIPNRYSDRKIVKTYFDMYYDIYKDSVTKTKITECQDIINAINKSLSVFEYDQKSQSITDMNNLYFELFSNDFEIPVITQEEVKEVIQ